MDVPTKYIQKHHVEKKTVTIYQHILPQILSPEETLILSETVRQILDFRKTMDLQVEGLQLDMAVFGKIQRTGRNVSKPVWTKKMAI